MLKEKKKDYIIWLYINHKMMVYGLLVDGLESQNNRGSENIPIHFILWPHKYETMLWISFEYQKERRTI